MKIDRNKLIFLYKEYVSNGGIVSPMNTESCRRYLEEKTGETIDPEDILWCFYQSKKYGFIEVNVYGKI